jgi:hypothetical protein
VPSPPSTTQPPALGPANCSNCVMGEFRFATLSGPKRKAPLCPCGEVSASQLLGGAASCRNPSAAPLEQFREPTFRERLGVAKYLPHASGMGGWPIFPVHP